MPDGKTIRIVIADDHPIFRGGLRRLLESQPDFRVVAEAGDVRQTVALTRQLKPDILLLDVAMPLGSGLEALRELSLQPLKVRTIVLTAGIEEKQMLEAFRLGARGIVVKGDQIELLLKGIRAVIAGEFWVGRAGVANVMDYLRQAGTHAASESENPFGLTAREMDIISQILSGSTNKDIATRFSISTETVKRHLSNIYQKLGVSNRLELALFATSHKLGKA